MKLARNISGKEKFGLVKDVEKLKNLIAKLEKQHGISAEKIIKLLKSEITIPITIFRQDLTPLESVVKYLKENLGYSLREIGSLLGRNEKNIWHTYADVRRKFQGKLIVKETEYFIPVSIFANREVSAFEALAIYLKDFYSLSYHEIAVLLQRDDRTVWTVCHRALAKAA